MAAYTQWKYLRVPDPTQLSINVCIESIRKDAKIYTMLPRKEKDSKHENRISLHIMKKETVKWLLGNRKTHNGKITTSYMDVKAEVVKCLI